MGIRPGPPGPPGPPGATGVFLEFDCEPFENITLTSPPGPPSNPTANLASVTIDLDEEDNLVWLTAYATWTASVGNQSVTFRIVRNETTVCSARDQIINPDPAGGVTTTALTCCDTPGTSGPQTYTLVAEAINLPANQTVTIEEGTLTAAEIST